MTVGTCNECGNEWSPRRDPEELEDPKCPECAERSDISFSDDDGPVLKQQGRKDRLRDALSAVPGVGDAGVEYATMMYDMTDASEGPEELYAVVAEIEGVSDQQARRVADAVFQVSPDGRDPAPFDHGGDTDDGGESFIDQLAKAREAGLLGDSGGAEGTITIQRDDGTTVEVPADHPAVEELVGGGDGEDPMAEALETLGQQIQQSNRMLAEALKDDGGETSEIEELKAELRELKEEKERERIEELREEIRDLKDGSAEENIEALRLKKGHEILEDAPTASAEAAEAWEDVIHSALSRLKDYERQRAMMSESAGPAYTPPEGGHGEQAPSPRQAAAAGQPAGEAPEGRRESPAEPQENSRPTETTDTEDHDTQQEETDMAERNPDPVTEQRAKEVREKLNLTDGDGEAAEVDA